MLEYIKSLILGILTGITAPLPVSSSGHFSLGNNLLGFAADGELSALYYSVFMIVFSVVIMFSLREPYSKLFRGSSKNSKNYKLRLKNLLFSVVIGALLFIPIPGLGKSFTDYFNLFLTSENILNSILTGAAAVFTGLIIAVSVWYIKRGRGSKKKTVPARSAVRMCVYSLPAYIIPGTSKIALSSVNLALCDVKSDVLFREAYFYIAPQVFIVNLIRTLLLLAKGLRPEITSLLIGVAAVALAALLVIAIIRKTDSGKLLLFFSAYAVLFGTVIIAYTLIPIFSGV